MEKNVIENVDLRDWTTMNEIQQELREKHNLHVSDREVRRMIDDYNNEYRLKAEAEGWYIVASSNGYCRTQRHELMIQSDERAFNRAIGTLRRVYKNRKARGESMNERLEINLDIHE